MLLDERNRRTEDELRRAGPLERASSDALDHAIASGLDWLDDSQHADGYWVGMLESNACIEAEWLLAMHFLGIESDPKRNGLVRAILDRQRDDGSWEIYYGAPRGDVNSTVESYAALRAVGMEPNEKQLRKAREWILANDALTQTRVFTRYWLALIGEWPWAHTPNIPPEVIYLPRWFPFNIYNFASWARATMMPVSLLSARRATRPLPEERRLDELFPQGRDRVDYSLPRGEALSWRSFFLRIDRALHVYQGLGFTPGREAAIRMVSEWIIKHQDADGAWGGIQPPWIYSLMALHNEGYSLRHPVIARGLAALDAHWSYQKGSGTYIQASESPVWDTLLALLAMLDCGRQFHDTRSMRAAVDWVLEQQITAPGDWKVKVPHAEPGGWSFERANVFYPDIDDTAVALTVLARLRPCYSDRTRLDRAIEAALQWMLAMQSSNGGWAAFDKDNDKAILTKIPFCDFGEALDPPSVDVTGHVLEALGLLGLDRSHPAVARGLAFIRADQEDDGSWFGRWGVNHIYGTAAVLPALRALGEDMRAPYIRTAAEWIVGHQNADGGWGESPGSYMDHGERGRGDSTPSQTGWALMALIAASEQEHAKVIERGVHFLLACQRSGTWDEPHYTGTGFPGYGIGARMRVDQQVSRRLHQGTELARGFMINYNLYRHYFPLMALGRARQFLRGGASVAAGPGHGLHPRAASP